MISYLLFLCIFLSQLTCSADTFNIGDLDKQTHIAVSYGLALTSTLIFEKNEVPRAKSVLYGSLVTFAAGLAKEFLIDTTPSGADMAANTIGVLASAGVVFAFEF